MQVGALRPIWNIAPVLASRITQCQSASARSAAPRHKPASAAAGSITERECHERPEYDPVAEDGKGTCCTATLHSVWPLCPDI